MTQVKKAMAVLCVSMAFVGCTNNASNNEAEAPQETMETAAPADTSAYDECMQNATTDEAKSSCEAMNADNGANEMDAPADEPTEAPADAD